MKTSKTLLVMLKKTCDWLERCNQERLGDYKDPNYKDIVGRMLEEDVTRVKVNSLHAHLVYFPQKLYMTCE